MSTAFLLLLPQLVTALGVTIEEVKVIVNTVHPGMTDAELNAVLDLIISKAKQHQAQAEADSKP